MRGEDLISEGHALLSSSLELTTEPSPGRAVGVWGARVALEADGKRLEHVISVDCSWLQAHGFPVAGTLSLYSDGLSATPVLEPESPFRADAAGGRLLWGTESPSFPPPEALCLHGSERLASWLRDRGWSREDGAEAVIYRTAEGDTYVRAWQERCPLYRNGPAAVLGGWPVMWPDDDEYEARGRLVLWTLRDAEPWIEVWIDRAGRLSAVARMT